MAASAAIPFQYDPLQDTFSSFAPGLTAKLERLLSRCVFQSQLPIA
jgi:hypothetical protein